MLRPWTLFDDMMLRMYWNVEGKTTSQVAKLLNRSIGSIVGRVYHLDGMVGRPRDRPLAAPFAPQKNPPHKAFSFAFDGGGVLFNENKGCKWPTSETHFCGKTMVETKPYCSTHCRRAYE